MSFNKLFYLPAIIIMANLTACVAEYNSVEFQRELNVKLADTSASKETVLLFHNLKKLSDKKIIFGHQDATAYGVGWKGEPDRSDIKSVINAYPGLYGWDFGFLSNGRKVDPENHPTTKLVKEAFKRGGVNAFCWHYNNPVTDGSFYDTTIAVEKILPGGGYYLKYLRTLDAIADYAKGLVDSLGNLIPVIFRPFHELDGNWFWWGRPFCTREQFIYLWRTTVEYLRDKRGIKNILWAYSPDRNFKDEKEFLERYPGDEYVDVVGVDNYWDFTPDGEGLEAVTKKLQIVSDVALQRNKIAAFTETGLEGIPNERWWTDRLLKAMDKDSIKLAFVMVWRNADEKHHYAPYKGHISESNFVEFSFSPKILFENHLPDLYQSVVNEESIKEIDRQKRLEIIFSMGTPWLRF